MSTNVSLNESLKNQTTPSEIFDEEFEENLFDDSREEKASSEVTVAKNEVKKTISVGDSLPYGISLSYGTRENTVRMKDVGVKKRILVLGVIGSFTPYCWNRHLFRVLQKSHYYEERHIDYICCISTNDPYTQRAWALFLGCDETIIMFSDISARFTQAIGMDVVVPWLDNRIRSKRYLIYAEDMVVLKMITAPIDGEKLNWQCAHLKEEHETDEDLSSDIDTWL